MKDSIFNLEKMYAMYLEQVELSEETMGTVQRKETKQAYFGACAHLLILIRDELPKLPEDEGMEAYQYMLDQVRDYLNNIFNP